MRVEDRYLGAVLLGAALILGGGSSLFPVERLIVELVGAGVLAWRVAHGWRAPADAWSAAAVLFCVLLLALPLAQMLPLPQATWSALPGRDDPARIIRAAGLYPLALPISLQPDETREAAVYLIAPIAMFLATLHARARDRVLFGWVVVGVTLSGALLGLTQAGSGAGVYVYDTAHRGAALGFFANKNHHADLLLIAILLTAALTRASPALDLRSPPPFAAIGVIAVLTATLVAANSRMGFALLPVALVPALVLLAPPALVRRAPVRAALALAGGAGLLALIGVNSGAVSRVLARFSGGEADERLRFWPDVVFAVQHYMPVGSGLGTFVAALQRDERLATLNFTYIPHAHDDYLEIALEAGVAGISLIGLGALLWLVAGWRALRRSAWGAFTPVHVACLASFAVLAVHSIVDYPLRTLALSCTFGFLAGCMGSAPGGSATPLATPTRDRRTDRSAV